MESMEVVTPEHVKSLMREMGWVHHNGYWSFDAAGEVRLLTDATIRVDPKTSKTIVMAAAR